MAVELTRQPENAQKISSRAHICICLTEKISTAFGPIAGPSFGLDKTHSTRRNILLFFFSRYMRPTHSTKIVSAGLITPTNFSKRNRNEMKWGKTPSTLNVLRNSLFTSSSSSPSSSLSFFFFSLTRNECVERVEIYVSHTNGEKVLKRHYDVNCNN